MKLISEKLIVILSLLTLLFTIPGTAQEIETLNKYRRLQLADDYYNHGLSAYEKNEYDSARHYLENSVHLDPNNYMAYYFLGSTHERLANMDKALLNYTLSISIKPEFTEALFSRATLYYKLNRYQESIEDFKLLLELPEGETQAVFFRGINYGSSDGETGFDEIISMAKNEADIYQYLGQNYKKLKKFDVAIQYFTKAIELQPEDGNYYVNRGLTFAEAGKTDSARMDYRKALDINPENSIAKLNIAFLSDEEFNFSLESLNEFIARNPYLAIGYVNRAYYYYKKSLFRKAISDYDSAILLDPENHEYYIDRGMAFEKLENYKSAITNYKTAARIDPVDPRIWNQMGNVFYKLEEFSESINHYSRSLSLDPTSGNTYYNRGLAYFYSDNPDKACQDMHKAKSLNIQKAEVFLRKNCH